MLIIIIISRWSPAKVFINVFSNNFDSACAIFWIKRIDLHFSFKILFFQRLFEMVPQFKSDDEEGRLSSSK